MTSQVMIMIWDQAEMIRQIDKKINKLKIYTKKWKSSRSVNLVSSASRLESYIMKWCVSLYNNWNEYTSIFKIHIIHSLSQTAYTSLYWLMTTHRSHECCF